VQPETTSRKLMWAGVNVLVLLYAFIPVLWLVALSLKDDKTLNDGNYVPVSPSGKNYSAIFSNCGSTPSVTGKSSPVSSHPLTKRSRVINFPATCANWIISSNAPSSCRKERKSRQTISASRPFRTAPRASRK